MFNKEIPFWELDNVLQRLEAQGYSTPGMLPLPGGTVKVVAFKTPIQEARNLANQTSTELKDLAQELVGKAGAAVRSAADKIDELSARLKT